MCSSEVDVITVYRSSGGNKDELLKDIISLIDKSKSMVLCGDFNSAHADGGPRSRVAHTIPSAQPPIDVSGNFPAHVSAESPSNISPNPSEVISEVSEP